MTNEEQATEFLCVVANKLPALKRSFKRLAIRLSFPEHSVDDVFNDSILKAHDTISRKGFTPNPAFNDNGYSAYFTAALLNNITNANIKFAKERTSEQVTLSTITHYDEELYVMYVKPEIKTEASEAGDDEDTDEREKEYATMVRNIKVKNAFDELPAKFKDVLNMRYDGMKYREISRILSIPLTTVKMRLNTARGVLKNKCKNNG